MISNDLLLTISSICFVICAIPQLIRNWKYKDTFTQSIIMNSFILVGTSLSIIAYISLHLTIALMFLFVEFIITIILLIQIIVWRKTKDKTIKKEIEKVESARAFIRSVRGLR